MRLDGAAETKAPADTLLETIEREVLGTSRFIFFILGLPPFLVLAVLFLRQTMTVWLGLELVGMATVGASLLLTSMPHRYRKMGTAGGLTLAAVMALFHFGPLIGTGLLFTLAALAGAYFFGRGGAITTYLTLVGGFALFVVASLQGWVVAPPTPNLQSADVVRLGLSTTLFLAASSVVFLRVRLSIGRAVGAEVAAREAERAAQAEQEKLHRSLETSQRLESLGRLAAGIAHGVNNALVAIQGGAAMVPLADDKDEQAGFLDEIGQGVARAAGLTRQLLSLCRDNTEAVGACDPLGALEGIVARLSLPTGVTLKVEGLTAWPSGSTTTIRLREAALADTVQHLVKNAVEAMPDGGVITISLGRNEHSGDVEVSVADTGGGMSSDVRERAFDPFFTTKGTLHAGLGLSLVWATVNAAEGSVVITSSPDGTRVTARFPADDPAPQTAAPPSTTPTTSRRILVVDDDVGVLKVMERFVSRAGFGVVAVESVAAAVAALKDEEFAMLVTDGVLQDGGANDVIRAFRVRHPGEPIVVCSGYLEKPIAVAGVSPGDWVSLRKPFDPGELVALVVKALGPPADETSKTD